VPLGVTSIVLVILQPVAVGAWCTLCLATAALMLAMIPLALDEVVAMVQFMLRARAEGQTTGQLWRTFWVGGSLKEQNEDTRTPRLTAAPGEFAPAMAWGVTLPWNLVLSAALGLWLIAAPALFGSQGAAADSDHLIGPLITTFAVIALAEVGRPVRFLNVLLGAWVVASPWVVPGASTAGAVNGLVVGLVVLMLSRPRGVVRERYAGWQRYIV
jgi:hypothetical protein